MLLGHQGDDHPASSPQPAIRTTTSIASIRLLISLQSQDTMPEERGTTNFTNHTNEEAAHPLREGSEFIKRVISTYLKIRQIRGIRGILNLLPKSTELPCILCIPWSIPDRRYGFHRDHAPPKDSKASAVATMGLSSRISPAGFCHEPSGCWLAVRSGMRRASSGSRRAVREMLLAV